MTDDHHHIDIYDALLLLETREEAQNFLKDLCTPHERAALQERWRVCQFLDEEKLSYRQIHAATGASLTTIGRVARFIKNEPYHGYRAILDKMKRKT